MFVSLARVATIPLDRVSPLYVRLLCPSELADTYTITHSSDSEQIVSHAAKHSFKLAYNLNDFISCTSRTVIVVEKSSGATR